MNKTITAALTLSILTLASCGSSASQTDDVARCKQNCEQAMDENQKQYCLSACETAKQYADDLGKIPASDITTDFNEDIYGNMNEQQKASMEAMQEAGMIPEDLYSLPTE